MARSTKIRDKNLVIVEGSTFKFANFLTQCYLPYFIISCIYKQKSFLNVEMTFEVYLFISIFSFNLLCVSGSNTSTEKQNYGLHNFYSSRIIIRMMKEKGHTAYTAESVALEVFNLITWRKEIAGETQSQIG